MNLRLFSMLVVLGIGSGCAGCDDTASSIDAGIDFAASEDAATDSDTGLDPADAGGHDDLGRPDSGGSPADMGGGDSADTGGVDAMPDMAKPPGPRSPLAYRGHRLIQEPRVSSFDLETTDGAFYIATSSAGDDVIFSLGSGDELTIPAVFPDTFVSIWARYGNDLSMQDAAGVSYFPGGPRAGGTSQAQELALGPNDERLMAGRFGGSVQFGNTVWSSTFSNAGGVLATAYEGYVIRATDSTVEALYRLRTTDAYESVSVRGLIRHADGDLSVAGQFAGRMVLPDDSELLSADGRGFVVHSDEAGTPQWTLQGGGNLYASAAGDDLFVRMSVPSQGEYLFDGMTYPALNGTRAMGLAKVDAAGNVVWLRQVEASNPPFFEAPVQLDDGSAVLVYRAGDETWFEGNPPADTTGDSHLARLDADGEFVWNVSMPDAPGGSFRQVAPDESGIVWTTFASCEDVGYTLSPLYSPDIDVPACAPPDAEGNRPWRTLVLGYDAATGELAYGNTIASGSFGIDALATLSDGALVVAARYYQPVELFPDTPDATVADGLLPSPNASTTTLIVLE